LKPQEYKNIENLQNEQVNNKEDKNKKDELTKEICQKVCTDTANTVYAN